VLAVSFLVIIFCMRLDQFLKASRLIIRRSVATEVSRAGAVQVNDAPAKAAREIKPDDIITLRRRGQILRVRVAALPAGNVPKNQAAALYEILSSEPYNEIEEILATSSADNDSDDDDGEDD
jgi:ribosomal 50S subunit-recycling heat shock protein